MTILMETTNENIIRLLEMLDTPEAYSEQEIEDIINRDEDTRKAYSMMVEAKRSSRQRKVGAAVDVNAAWQRFKKAHPQPFQKGGKYQSSEEERKLVPLPWGGGRGGLVPYRKIAASFIGVLLVSGIAFAAIKIVRNINTSNPQLPTTEQMADIEPVTSLPTDTVNADTIATVPYLFNNVPLDSMLTAIAAAHGLRVMFENEAARGLRFHFVWKREDSLARIVEKLNTFEAVNIAQEDKTLVVR